MDKLNIKKLIMIIGCVVIVLLICLLIAGNINLQRELKQTKQEKELIDTTYNHITLDSIEYHINKKDTIIYNYKQQMNYEITKSIELNDSAAVQLFYQLVAEQ